MLKTTNYKVTLENEHYADLFKNLSAVVADHESRMMSVRLLDEIESVVIMEVKRHNYNNSSQLEWGRGGNHIWIAQKSTGDRIVLISYDVLHRMNTKVKA